MPFFFWNKGCHLKLSPIWSKTDSGNLKINKIKSLPSKGLKPNRGADKQKILMEINCLPQKNPRSSGGHFTQAGELLYWQHMRTILRTFLLLFNPHDVIPIINLILQVRKPSSERLNDLLNLTKQMAHIIFIQPCLTTKTMHLLIYCIASQTAICKVYCLWLDLFIFKNFF